MQKPQYLSPARSFAHIVFTCCVVLLLPSCLRAQPAIAPPPPAVFSQQPVPQSQTPTPALFSQTAPQPPLPVTQPAPFLDPPNELKSAVLIAALKLGGYVLYMRHAISTVGSDGALTTIPNWWENCATQRNIADAGRNQARKVGVALRALSIPFAEIKTSQFCRARDTAHEMGLGAIEITEDLNHAVGQRPGFDVNAARIAQLSRKPISGSNTLLVSHTHGSPKAEERAMGSIQEAEIVVYRPYGAKDANEANASVGTEPIGRLLVSDWDALIPNLNALLNVPPTAVQSTTPQK